MWLTFDPLKVMRGVKKLGEWRGEEGRISRLSPSHTHTALNHHIQAPMGCSGMDDDYRGIPHYGSPIVTGGRRLYKGGRVGENRETKCYNIIHDHASHARVPIPYSGLWVGIDDDGPLHHIGEGEEVEVRVGLDVVFTACLLPLGECLHGGRHQGNGSMEGDTRGMAA